jgi:uncharacterized protein (TIGR04255 family)
MTDGSGMPGRFEPVHDAHAIEQVVIGLTFGVPIAESTMRNAVKVISDNFKDSFPGSSDIRTVTFAIGQNSPPVQSPFGRVFQKHRPDGSIERALRLEPAALHFQTSQYTRWPKLWDEVWEYFKSLLPIYLPEGKFVSSFKLNFVDMFYWVGEESLSRANFLLRPGSRFVCPHVHEADDLWHSYTGAFIRAGERRKRLLNVNIDCLDENQVEAPRRCVRIRTSITDLLNQPGYKQVEEMDESESSEFTCRVMSEMHSYSKEVFAEIIGDQMCKRVGL